MSDKIGYIFVDRVIEEYTRKPLQEKRDELERNPPEEILREEESIRQHIERFRKEFPVTLAAAGLPYLEDFCKGGCIFHPPLPGLE